MKVLFEKSSDTQKQNVPVYKNFRVGRIRVGNEIFTIKIKDRSPEQICDIQQKWSTCCTRNKIKKQVKDTGWPNRERKI